MQGNQILSALEIALGTRWPPSAQLNDSDFFQRDKKTNPHVSIRCEFDEIFFTSKRGESVDCFNLTLDADGSTAGFFNDDGEKLFISNDVRSALQSYFVDAERSINYQLGYASKYTLLSRFSHSVHEALTDPNKDTLGNAYETIKKTFEGVPEYAQFFESFKNGVADSVRGFSHGLEVDFSAFDPNNYANAMRVVATENGNQRSFDEFGTGEQQILLMAFAKAYAQTFSKNSLVLIIEEPEAHLHPLALRWLKEYIYNLCGDGLQVVLSTHSPDFVDMNNLDGIARVYKTEDGLTHVKQVSKSDLVNFCIDSGVPENKVSERGIGEYYETKLTPDQAKGFFANQVLLVEGETELKALPVFFRRLNHSLASEGVEIVSCGGKNAIPLLWRLFSAFDIECKCLFDADGGCGNNELCRLLGISQNQITTSESAFVCGDRYAFYRYNFEKCMKAQIAEYEVLLEEIRSNYLIKSKPSEACVMAKIMDKSSIPIFVFQLWDMISQGTEESVKEPVNFDEFGSYGFGAYDALDR